MTDLARIREETLEFFGVDVSDMCLDCVYLHPDRKRACSCLQTPMPYGTESCDVRIPVPFRISELQLLITIRKRKIERSKTKSDHVR